MGVKKILALVVATIASVAILVVFYRVLMGIQPLGVGPDVAFWLVALLVAPAFTFLTGLFVVVWGQLFWHVFLKHAFVRRRSGHG